MTLFTPETQWTEAAALSGVHGPVVATALGVFSLGIFIIAWWPHSRRAKGEIYGEEPGEWKDE